MTKIHRFPIPPGPAPRFQEAEGLRLLRPQLHQRLVKSSGVQVIIGRGGLDQSFLSGGLEQAVKGLSRQVLPLEDQTAKYGKPLLRLQNSGALALLQGLRRFLQRRGQGPVSRQKGPGARRVVSLRRQGRKGRRRVLRAVEAGEYLRRLV